MEVVSLRRTCTACPSQWEGLLDNDDYLYVRYRHGIFSAGTGNTIDAAVGNQNVHYRDYAEPLDGYMTNITMMNKLKAAGLLFHPDVEKLLMTEEEWV